MESTGEDVKIEDGMLRILSAKYGEKDKRPFKQGTRLTFVIEGDYVRNGQRQLEPREHRVIWSSDDISGAKTFGCGMYEFTEEGLTHTGDEVIPAPILKALETLLADFHAHIHSNRSNRDWFHPYGAEE